MPNYVTDVRLVSGFLEVSKASGADYQIAATDFLRAADIPDLNIDSLTLLTKCAQVLSVLIQTLAENGTIGEELAEGFDMQYAVETLTDDLGAEFGGG